MQMGGARTNAPGGAYAAFLLFEISVALSHETSLHIFLAARHLPGELPTRDRNRFGVTAFPQREKSPELLPITGFPFLCIAHQVRMRLFLFLR